MFNNLQQRIDDRLNQLFSFKRVGDWYRNGVCPQCNKKDLWTHATNPRVVTCSHINKCGYSEHVKDICEDLFKKWSEDHPQTAENPNAAADAYLMIGRGLDINKFKGSYKQETHTDKTTGESTATVRFTLSNGDWWQRFIDDTKRFEKNFNWNYGAKYKGLWWQPPQLDLLQCNEIWITEGILKALALTQQGIAAVSAMSASNYPELELQKLEKLCIDEKIKKPTIIWAFDNDKAGNESTLKFHKLASEQGWNSTAAQPPFSRNKVDWNDLLERNLLNPEDIKKYRHYGKLLIAKSSAEAGLLIYNYNDGKRRTFYFNHQNRLYWFDLDINKYQKAVEELETQHDLSEEEKRQQALHQCSAIKEICNAQLTPLYYQKNKVTNEAAYYFNVTAPWGEVKTEFTPDQLASRSRFKPAVMGSLAGAMWTGSENQLEIFVKRETEGLKTVDTIDWMGYTPEHKAYIFHQYAVHKGNVIEINQQDYFKVGRIELKTLSSSPKIMINPKDKFNPGWFKNFYRVRGAKGLIILAWWTGVYFAEQIRALHSSYPFIEFVGQAGAGKSRFIEMLWKLSGRPDYEGFDPNKSTSVAVYRNFAQISNLPVVLIEGDRNDQNGNQAQKPKFSWDEMKDAFNGRAIRSKGLKTAGNETYEPPFRGGIMISQNTPILASEAILTRTLHVEIDRRGQTLETKRIVDDLDRIPVEQMCTYMTHCLRNEAAILQTYADGLKELEDSYHAKGVSHTRVALCHAQVASLIDALAKHVFDGYIDLDQVIDAQNELVQMAIDRIESLGQDHIDVQRFWETYDYLTVNRNIGLNHHKDTEPTVAINLNEFYKAAAENRQQLPDSNIMRGLLSSSRKYKFAESNRSVRSAIRADPTTRDSKITVKCWIFYKPIEEQVTSNKTVKGKK